MLKMRTFLWLLISPFLQNPNESSSVDDIWHGKSVNSGMMSKWVASKFKSIAATIGVAFSGCES